MHFILLYFHQFYETDLEDVPEFNRCAEWVETYDLSRGKKIEDEDDDIGRMAGKFKVIKIQSIRFLQKCHSPWLVVDVVVVVVVVVMVMMMMIAFYIQYCKTGYNWLSYYTKQCN